MSVFRLHVLELAHGTHVLTPAPQLAGPLNRDVCRVCRHPLCDRAITHMALRHAQQVREIQLGHTKNRFVTRLATVPGQSPFAEVKKENPPRGTAKRIAELHRTFDRACETCRKRSGRAPGAMVAFAVPGVW